MKFYFIDGAPRSSRPSYRRTHLARFPPRNEIVSRHLTRRTRGPPAAGRGAGAGLPGRGHLIDTTDEYFALGRTFNGLGLLSADVTDAAVRRPSAASARAALETVIYAP
ncbi:hypothetical protein EVAR_51794_1 [Eumeta japonica]|uniref:Uncharacterized protein n=1 Tax=Eumeta variegata TaxID=151549 RepID=A0A4C2A218_EUMVA|nr:hypothetical protein EVAR_51794_1 [Eumeta japonica]